MSRRLKVKELPVVHSLGVCGFCGHFFPPALFPRVRVTSPDLENVLFGMGATSPRSLARLGSVSGITIDIFTVVLERVAKHYKQRIGK
jgi:hypothetical protein